MSVQRAWALLALAVAGVGFAAYTALILATGPGDDTNTFANNWLYEGLIAFSVLIAASRVVLVPRDRFAWLVVALSLACTSFAELYYLAVQPENYPSVADYGWIAFYPLVYVGMVLLIRRRARSARSTLWLDGLIASVAAAALGAAVLVEVVLRTTEGEFAAVATNLAYPLGDVLLLSAVFGAFSLSGWHISRRWVLLGLGVLATTVADGVYLLTVDTYVPGNEVDILWPASTLLIAAAAWVDDADDRALSLEGRPLLAVPAFCALLATGILVYDHFNRVNILALGLAAATLLLVVVRLAVTFSENSRLFDLVKHESITDALTGLSNRRKLIRDLESRLEDRHASPTLLMMFDLNGFKGYNDSFGHPAGDALLMRLGEKLAGVPGERGSAYRLGGDEFCLVATVGSEEVEPLIDRACIALSEHGEGFEISTSFGAIMLPDEATDASEALQLADERLYAQKHSRRGETDRTMHALLEALAEREPGMYGHTEGLASLTVATGRMLGLRRDELDELARAAQLHDLGKLAVPDQILQKSDPLDELEEEFIRQHTLVGERILRASPAFRSVAPLVRSSHEHWDGTGYPDGLAGEEIPLGSRIIRAADAYVSMITPRGHRTALSPAEALAVLESGSGREFDPAVVRVLAAHVRDEIEAERAA
jgi:two-component system, cell cycle response regulator